MYYLIFSNDTCIIKATDSEIGLSINTNNIQIEAYGSFTANGKKTFRYYTNT